MKIKKIETENNFENPSMRIERGDAFSVASPMVKAIEVKLLGTCSTASPNIRIMASRIVHLGYQT